MRVKVGGWGANCYFLRRTSRSSRFYHSAQLYIIFTQNNSALKNGGGKQVGFEGAGP